MYDIAIIGAGVTGAMIARKLSAYNLKICVLEKEEDVSMGASMANSGIVHAGFDAVSGTLKAKLNVKGSEMMPQIASELGVPYKNNGSLVVGKGTGDLQTIKELYERGVKNGVKGLQLITSHDDLLKIEPNLNDDFDCGLYAPTGAIVCPYTLTLQAIGNAMDNKTELKLGFEVKGITCENDIYSLISDKETVKAKYVINAAGLFADEIARMAGDDSFKITPRKGEYMLLDKECASLVTHTVFDVPTKMGKGILVTPTTHGNIILGPTSVNIEDKNNKATTQEGFDLISKQARERIKNVPFGKTITSFCGLRAVGDTGDFIINSNLPRFINVAAIESPGLSASPAIAEYVADMLRGMGIEMTQKSDYNPYRKPYNYFTKLTNEEKNKLIAKDPDYGKIICRCETVTKGEIKDAMLRNPKPTSIDGIKRRTRASMGRCQGGFCYPHIIEIISEMLDIPYENVTKFGGNSLINLGKIKEDV